MPAPSASRPSGAVHATSAPRAHSISRTRGSLRTPPPMRSPRTWAIAGALLGGVVVLLLQAPATWLAAGVQRASAGQVQLLQARGTVWDGSAQLVFTGGQGSTDMATLPSRLEWQLRLQWRGVRADLRAACCTPQPLRAQATLGWGSATVKVNNHQSQWPAAVLAGLGTPWNTVQPQGNLALRTDGLDFEWAAGRMRMGGQVQLDALGMSSRLSTLRPMGSYRLVLDGGAAPTLTLSTLDGGLLIHGTGQWVGQRMRFTGEATSAPGSETALANLLNIIGRRTGARSVINIG